MELESFVARHAYAKQNLGQGVFLYTGYAIDLPVSLRIPSRFRLDSEMSGPNRKVYVSEHDCAVISIENSEDVHIVKCLDQEKFGHERQKLRDYYRDQNRRGGGTVPYYAKHAPCVL